MVQVPNSRLYINRALNIHTTLIMNAGGTKLHRVVQATMAGEPADECIFTPSRMIIGHSETCKHPLERHGYYYYQPTLSQPANCSLLVPMAYNVNN